uniref:Uncharacterized protein n=1 Tax=Anguilla anguilla TaxID=7936 RepID=A0A0E9V5U7_ANGAN
MAYMRRVSRIRTLMSAGYTPTLSLPAEQVTII